MKMAAPALSHPGSIHFRWPPASVRKVGSELKEHLARPSGWDPVERLKDQDIDGVAAEVLYTVLGMPLFALDDVELQQACFSVFNNWVAEYASQAPKRLYPIALISLEDIDAGVKELGAAPRWA
jgi:predicted TIM-barrel fold metal-dependent hydrolase